MTSSHRYSRRALLKGLGIGLGALPLLNSERARAQSGGVAKRLITVVWGSGVAPPSRAVPMRLSTVLGWDTTSDIVNPRKPVVGASAARTRTPV